MIEVKVQYPFIEDDGTENIGLIKHYAENENGERFTIRQIETGLEYSEAVDIYPCRYTYEATENKIEEIKEDEVIEE